MIDRPSVNEFPVFEDGALLEPCPACGLEPDGVLGRFHNVQVQHDFWRELKFLAVNCTRCGDTVGRYTPVEKAKKAKRKK